MKPSALPRRWLLRGLVVAVILLLLTPSVISAATYEAQDSALRAGAIRQPANGTTVVGVQGFHFRGKGATKKPARMVAFGPRGELQWRYNGTKAGARWFYDVDPLPSGNVLVSATNPDGTLVMAIDPDTQQPVWIERLDIHDTHDVDLINGDQLLIANMRNYNATTGRNNDRVMIYNRSTDSVVWEWKFRNHGYTADGGGAYRGENDDWTHVNDVDKIGDGRYLVSPRNFDQVIVIDRETKNITRRLGTDDAHDIMHEQHNPQYLQSADGNPTILVADSENDRIVEYAYRDGEWVQTWELGGPQVFSWPRDADRLPNGNTLVVDSLNHRVIEVTPTGRIVWEVYAPWGTYDAERIAYGDEGASAGDLPTIADMNASGTYTVTGSAGLVPGTGDRLTFAQRLVRTFAGTPLESQARWFASRWAHIAPWIYPVWMSGWDFLWALLAGIILAGWIATEAVFNRHRLRERYRRHLS
ncbi:MAG: arylsulfotransferase family protein [Halobacteriales archaeon]|nr:arylsulfotransferase family protein [Halobacteriales archaeon]